MFPQVKKDIVRIKAVSILRDGSETKNDDFSVAKKNSDRVNILMSLTWLNKVMLLQFGNRVEKPVEFCYT